MKQVKRSFRAGREEIENRGKDDGNWATAKQAAEWLAIKGMFLEVKKLIVIS